MSKLVTVRLTLDWTFDEKEWDSEIKHIEEMKSDPRIVFGYDIHDSIHHLNSLSYPEIKGIKVFK